MSEWRGMFALRGEEWQTRRTNPEDTWRQSVWDAGGNLSGRHSKYEQHVLEAEAEVSKLDAEWRLRLDDMEKRFDKQLSQIYQRGAQVTIPVLSPRSERSHKLNLNSPPSPTRLQTSEKSAPLSRSRAIFGTPASPSVSGNRPAAAQQFYTSRPQAAGRVHHQPLPKPTIFDEKSTWESFITPFESLARNYGWDEAERLFRLTHSLRGEAAEYAFGQIPPEYTSTYASLRAALEARFKERRSPTSYLAELEAQKYSLKEDISQHIASLRRLTIKAYPTADDVTRETIVLRHFLRSLPDQSTSIAVGMSNLRTVEDARAALETYNSLRDDVTRPLKVKNVKVQAATPSDTDNVIKNGTPTDGQDNDADIVAALKELLDVMKQSMSNHALSRSSLAPRPRAGG